jgi:hypothetical protein
MVEFKFCTGELNHIDKIHEIVKHFFINYANHGLPPRFSMLIFLLIFFKKVAYIADI